MNAMPPKSHELQRQADVSTGERATGLQERLRQTLARWQRIFETDVEQVEERFLARAARLARPKNKANDGRAALSALEFRLADEHYAIELAWVREVCPLQKLTPIPCTPDFVAGVISVRGNLWSVTDLRRLFELPQTELSDTARIIGLSSEEMEFGILADELFGTRRFYLDEIQPAPLTGRRADYLRGITVDRVVVLDGRALLADRRLVVCDEAAK